MSALADLLAERIRASGPITIAEYMAECLIHPEHGYYTNSDPLGAQGDFVTAPEISQMFGEMVGLCLAQAWLDQGAPDRSVLAELGPGRGTLMADILRATSGVAGFHAALSVHLIEASPVLRAAQASVLTGFAPTWHDRVADLPDGPLFLIANEFFDALPIRQFQRVGDVWREVVVGLKDGALRPGLGGPVALPGLDQRLADTPDGGILETCEPAKAILAEISTRIAAHGGAALIIDYGDWAGHGDTFQAVRNHRHSDPFAEPGEKDLTAHVDFAALTDAVCDGAACSDMIAQGVFLERLGITERARALAQAEAQREGPRAADRVVSDHRRLTHPDEMGSLFKVIGIVPANAPLPAGLDT